MWALAPSTIEHRSTAAAPLVMNTKVLLETWTLKKHRACTKFVCWQQGPRGPDCHLQTPSAVPPTPAHQQSRTECPEDRSPNVLDDAFSSTWKRIVHQTCGLPKANGSERLARANTPLRAPQPPLHTRCFQLLACAHTPLRASGITLLTMYVHSQQNSRLFAGVTRTRPSPPGDAFASCTCNTLSG